MYIYIYIYIYILSDINIGIDISKIILYTFSILNFILQMRKYQNKDKVFKFKGSVFVQFETLDSAKAFMNVESVKYEDTELIRKWV